MTMVKWNDEFGTEHILTQGKGDHVFFVIPELRDENGNSRVNILSLKAMKEFIEKAESK